MAKKSLPPAYNPKLVEDKWYSHWLDKGYFRAEIDRTRKPFSIAIPPPNVTGSLHIGHALNNTLQDIVVRKKRMQGYATLWVPGTDHAGIATQNVVEQQLAREGIDRRTLGREKFIERVWQWKEQYGRTIISQLKKLGCSCDWSRERFTLDAEYSLAVRRVFVQLYQEGLIYRGDYIINWCPRCMTALSDIEVEHEDVRGHLYYIRYPFRAEKSSLTVATTRPETMLGDTAVAVNPKDKRYRDVVGKTLVLPLIGREIPVIADDFVDPAFGTGAVKVTPAHDPNDFEIGLRHKLPQVNIFTEEAILNEEAGAYAGLDRYKGREEVLRDLKAQGLLEKEEEHEHAVGHCYRCQTVVEPYLSKQWFVRMKPLAEPAIRAVKDGDIEFIPARWKKIYFDWMENIRDWCISRQLWWGHRIPVWYCGACEEMIVSEEEPRRCPGCGGSDLKQDTDVLDTWFSSWLWPFATLGWPEKMAELEYFYPTSLLSTAFDIIFFWVARMIMAGLHFTEHVPFRRVYYHALIRDVKGRKMSKSRGNVIDPLEVIEWSGTDAFRFTLAALAVPGRDVLLSEDRIEGSRHFANKIWNASRFVLMNLDGYDPGFEPRLDELDLADRWILSRLSRAVAAVNDHLDQYNYSEAARLIHAFFWGELCDWYVEWSKQRLDPKRSSPADRRTVQWVLVTVLDSALRLLHPIMPFITEEIWQQLPTAGQSIMISPWPTADESRQDAEAEQAAALLIEVTDGIRRMRHDLKVPPSKKVPVVLEAGAASREILDRYQDYLKVLARVDEIVFEKKGTPLHQAMKAVVSDVEVFLPVASLVDVGQEQERLSAEISRLDREIEAADKKLANKKFVENAAADVVEKVRRKMGELKSTRQKLEEQLKILK